MYISLKNCENAYEDLSFDKDDFVYYTSPFISQIGLADKLSEYNEYKYRLTIGSIFKQFCKYYIKLIVYLIFHLLETLAYFIQRFSNTSLNVGNQKLIFIDCYVLSSTRKSDHMLLDGYFPNLVGILEKLNYKYLIVPRLVWNKSPFESFNYFFKMRSEKNSLLTLYQILSLSDIIYSFLICLFYPFKLWAVVKTLEINDTNKFLIYYFFRTLDGTNFQATLRYMFGRRLSEKYGENLKIIQWFENQPFDKSLNFAVRQNNVKANIIGVQAFVWPRELVNYRVVSFYGKKCLPSRILVNGPYFKNNHEYELAPSLRYKRIFEFDIVENIDMNERILCLFSYFDKDNMKISSFLKNMFINSDKFLCKFHPTTNIERLELDIPFFLNITNDNIYDIFPKVSFVIGAASGALVEAIGCGLPVIQISENGKSNYSYLPDFCKGVLWEDAYDLFTFEHAKKSLLNVIKYNPDQRLSMIQKVRNEMFTEPTEARIIEAFELD